MIENIGEHLLSILSTYTLYLMYAIDNIRRSIIQVYN